MKMNPQEKAEELIKKFTAHAIGSTGEQNWINAKNCALICVEEILDVLNDSNEERERRKIKWEYWQSVKQHLQNL